MSNDARSLFLPEICQMTKLNVNCGPDTSAAGLDLGMTDMAAGRSSPTGGGLAPLLNLQTGIRAESPLALAAMASSTCVHMLQ